MRERFKNLSVFADVICASPLSQVLHSYFIIHPTGKCQMFARARSHLSDILVPSSPLPSLLPSISIRPPARHTVIRCSRGSNKPRQKTSFAKQHGRARDAIDALTLFLPRLAPTKYFVIIFAWNFELRYSSIFLLGQSPCTFQANTNSFEFGPRTPLAATLPGV